jgi:DNA-binding transcriptional LysR family regulator
METANFQHLPAFLAVAEHKSFSRAARALGVSASALSQAVRALEAQVGVPLLHRTTRSVSVTEKGEMLIARASPAMRQMQEALEAVATPKGELSGSLRLNVPGLALQVLSPVIEHFIRQHPRVHVEVIVENRLVNIVAERFDAGVRLIEATQRDMVATRISEPFRFVVVGSPAYLKRKGIPKHPSDLSTHELIGYRSPTTCALTPWDLEKRGRSWKVNTKGSLVTNHEGMLLDAALRGLGLSYVAELTAAEALARGRLYVVLADWAPEVPGLFLYYPSRKQSSANLRAFIDCVAFKS